MRQGTECQLRHAARGTEFHVSSVQEVLPLTVLTGAGCVRKGRVTPSSAPSLAVRDMSDVSMSIMSGCLLTPAGAACGARGACCLSPSGADLFAAHAVLKLHVFHT